MPTARLVELWQAILLGILQGLSEFLPISSTAHVTIAGHMMGLIDPNAPEHWTAFLAVIQLGTLGAVLTYFRHDLTALARGEQKTWRLAWLVLLATLPIAILGLALRNIIEGPLTKDLRVIAAALIGLGLLLLAADELGKHTRGERELTWRDAILIGLAQTFALIPGASRSGTTLTGGLFAGLDRTTAARFSFLMSIPAIGASGLLELPKATAIAPSDTAMLLIATLAAAASGYAAIAMMLRWLRTRGPAAFAWYRVALGAAVLAGVATGML